jgi:hypothetical protein
MSAARAIAAHTGDVAPAQAAGGSATRGEGARRAISDEGTLLARRPQKKACARCREVKPASAFRRRTEMKDGLSSWCSACHYAASRAGWTTNRDRYNAARRARAAMRR